MDGLPVPLSFLGILITNRDLLSLSMTPVDWLLNKGVFFFCGFHRSVIFVFQNEELQKRQVSVLQKKEFVKMGRLEMS